MVAATYEPTRARAPDFYVWMAGVCALIAFGAFAGTYWLQVPAGTFVGEAIIHLHAALFSAWTLLFVSQAWLASSGRMQAHRAWGVAGVSLATAMVFVGTAAAINSVAVSTRAGYALGAREFMIVPVSAVALFAGLFVAAIANIARPEWHKRLMLVATIGLLQAAMARVFFLAITGGGPGKRPGLAPPLPTGFTIGPGVVVDLLIVAGIVYDWRTRGRPHPAYLIAGAVTVAVQLARLPLAASPLWLAIADGLMGFGR